MITCPKCQSPLPDWATSCQFCGADVGKVARPGAVPTQKRASVGGPARWVWVTYYLIAGYWVVSGGLEILKTCTDRSGPNWVVIVFAGVSALLGVGLICQVEEARGISHICAWLKMLDGAGWTVVGLWGILWSPLLGIVLVIFGLLNVVTGGLMVYLIGETSRYAPS